MQDKRIHIDEKFIDHSWAEMRKQLDQEMPLKDTQRHRFAWWWFAVAGLIIMTAGASLFFWENGEHPTVPASQPGLPSISPPTQALQASPIAGVAPSNSSPTATDALVAKTKNPSTLNSKQKHVNELNPTETFTSSGKHAYQSEGSKSAMQDIFNRIEENYSTEMTAMATASNLEAKMAEPNQVEFIDLNNIPLTPQVPTVVAAAINPSRRHWHFALETKGSVSLRNSANGGSLHLIALKPLKNTRLSIEAGMGYSFIQQPLNIIESSAQLEGPLAPEGINGEVVYYGTQSNEKSFNDISNTGISTKYKQGLNLHYLSMPLQVSYRLGKRISLKSGIDAGLLLASKSDFTVGGIFYRASGFENADMAIGKSGQKLIADFDLALLGGLDFRFLTRWSVSASYRYGVRDVLPKNEHKDFNRLVQLGLRYYF